MDPTTDILRSNAGRLFSELSGSTMVTEEPGGWIGHYQLDSLLGEGGFGHVWRARQLEPVRREVAIKVIKLGMDTRQVLGRFNQERQTLASLEHPGIATFLDAGVGPDGRPFFAMELIHGEPITTWCEKRHSPIHERLRLFLLVCQAVQHAHQRGIIHRDLKPTNILVTSLESLPVPKVIDFGIAKAVNADKFTDQTLLTQTHQALGTPRYMSPEQICGSNELDTRSDVFSLGVLLYELLTGSLPFNVAVSADEMKRRIMEDAPARPSQVLRRSRRMEGPARSIAAPFDPSMPDYAPDLDWVIMKALEKDRDRRYQSTAELGADIQRFLHREPVLAHPPSAWYSVSRWMLRHRTLATAAAAVTLSMIVGTGAALWQASQAAHARRLAEAETRRALVAESLTAEANATAVSARLQAQQVATFLNGLLERAGSAAKDGRNAEALKTALSDSREQILALSTDPSLRIDLLRRVQALYTAVGEAKLAIPLAKTIADEMAKLHGAESDEAFNAELEYIVQVVDFGARATGPALLTALLKRIETHDGRGSKLWFDTQRQISRVWTKLDRVEPALMAAEELIAEARRQSLSRNALGVHLITYAIALEFGGKYDQAQAALDEAQIGASPKRQAEIDARLVLLLHRKGDFAAAAARLRTRLQLEETQFGKDSLELIPTLLRLGECEDKAGNRETGINHCRRAVSLARGGFPQGAEVPPAQRRPLWEALRDLADRENDADHHDVAIELVKECLAIAESVGDETMIIRALRDLGDFCADSGDLEAAYRYKQRSYDLNKVGANLRDAEQDLLELCHIRRDQGRAQEAADLASQLWQAIQARPESEADVHRLVQAATLNPECNAALRAKDPAKPDPPELAVWQAATKATKASRRHDE